MSTTTEILNADDPAALERASRLLAAGELVAFPTETVYGLGANGLNAEAVGKIFQAKGRPGDNPLILHVVSIEQALPLWQATDEQLELARKLADAFWPGPLSLVLVAAPWVPKAVTAGLDSVAVRAPAGNVARELLALCEFPVAAPSANLSGRPSPTCAAHVAATLEGKIAAILDGGRTRIGIESTVVDLRGKRPRILRPGDISAAAMQQVVGELETGKPGWDAPSPGLRHPHYQPEGLQLYLADGDAIGEAWDDDVAILCLTTTANKMGSRSAPLVILPANPRAYAAGFYDALYKLEGSGASKLLIERVPGTPDWEAVSDRLKRSAGK